MSVCLPQWAAVIFATADMYVDWLQLEIDAINLRSLKVEFAFDIHSLDLGAFW
jgi:hypothetical protein